MKTMKRKFFIGVFAVVLLSSLPLKNAKADFLCDVLGIGCIPPPPPTIEITCEKPLLISGWAHLPLCKTSGKANRGEIVIVKGKNFTPGHILSQNETIILKDGKFINGLTSLPNPTTINDDFYTALQVRGDGTFVANIMAPTAGETRDEKNKIQLGIYDVQVGTYNPRDQYNEKGKTRATARLEITGESRLPPEGAQGGFSFACSWTEWAYDENGNQQRTDKTSTSECPQGEYFEVKGGPIGRAERNRWGDTEWLAITPNGSCPLRSYGPGINGCVNVVENTFTIGHPKGKFGTAGTSEEKERERNMCKVFPNPKVGGADSNCEVEYVGGVPLEYPEGTVIQLTLRDDREPSWRAAGPTFVVKKKPTFGEKTYPTKYFKVEIDASNLTTISAPWDYPTLVPKHLDKGKALLGQTVSLPVRWSPQGNGGPKIFPLQDQSHALELVLDEGAEERKLEYYFMNPKENEWTLVFDIPKELDAKNPHALTVRCGSACAAISTVKDPDPSKSNKYWKVAYDASRARLEVVGLDALKNLPTLTVNPSVVKPGETMKIVGSMLPKESIVTAIMISDVKGSSYVASDSPSDDYAIIVPGYDKGKSLAIPVQSSGNVEITLPLPKVAGKLVREQGKAIVEATIMEKSGTRVKVKGEMTINDSDCLIKSENPFLLFFRESPDYRGKNNAITVDLPLRFMKTLDATWVYMTGNDFFCRTGIETPKVVWKNEGMDVGPLTLSNLPTAPIWIQGWSAETKFDGSFTGIFTVDPSWLAARNYLDVSDVRIIASDGKGRAGESEVPMVFPYRARVLPEDNDGTTTFQRGDTVSVHTWGFSSGGQVVVREWNEPPGTAWDAKMDAELTKKTMKRIYIERDPGTIDVRIPFDMAKGKHRFIMAEVTDGIASPQNRPRASFVINVGAVEDEKGGKKADDDKNVGAKEKKAGYVSVTPEMTEQGGSIKIAAENFAPLALLEITLGDKKVSSMGDYSTNEGKLEKEVRIPAYFKNGEYAITAKDVEGTIGTAKITIRGKEEEPTLTIFPYLGVPGTPVRLEGEHWDHDPKHVYMGGGDTTSELKIDLDGCNWTLDKKACEEGTLRLTVAIPEGTPPDIYAIAVKSPTSLKGAPFEVLKVPEKKKTEKPYITLQPQKGKWQLIVISGGNFVPKSGVIILFDKENMAIRGGFGTTNETGMLSGVSIFVPRNAKPGTHTITVKDGTSIASAEYVLLVEGETPPPTGGKEEPPKEEPKPKPAPEPGKQTGGYGDIQTKTYGNVETKSYGNVETKIYGDVQTKTYGDVQTKTYGDVQAPTYQNSYGEPAKQGEPCNPELPKTWQPGCKQSSVKQTGEFMARVSSPFSSFFKKLFGQKSKTRMSEPAPFLELEKEKQSNVIPDKPVPKKTGVGIREKEPIEPIQKITPAPPPSKHISGSFRCWSYNVSGGGGGNCRLFAPIEIRMDGTYSMSSESGTYKIEEDTIHLSESKIRGVGEIIDGNKIRFEYDYNGWHHILTYLKDGVEPFEETSATENVMREIPVEIVLNFDRSDGSLDYFSTMMLVPEGETIETAKYTPTALAVYDGEKTVSGSFHKQTNRPKTGGVYTIYLGSGTQNIKIGILDLKGTKENSIKKIIEMTFDEFVRLSNVIQ